jgi:hypothetical protein
MRIEPETRRASVPEIVGAWLHVWTPPRDVEVPPVPWRKLAIGALVLAVVCGAAAAVIVPAIDRGKERRASHEAARAAAIRAAERRRIVREQRPRQGHAAGLRDGALLAAAQRAISRDAAARVRAGELQGPVGPTRCAPAPDARPAPGRALFDCLTVVGEIKSSAANGAGAIGYPFRAVLDYRTSSYVWCKTNPVPGERIVPDPRTVIELPRVCRGA